MRVFPRHTLGADGSLRLLIDRATPATMLAHAAIQLRTFARNSTQRFTNHPAGQLQAVKIGAGP